jgi:hypothetical protein
MVFDICTTLLQADYPYTNRNRQSVFQIEPRTELRCRPKSRAFEWKLIPSRQFREHASKSQTTMPCFHLITSVARSSTFGGNVSPSDFAVPKLTMNSIFVA